MDADVIVVIGANPTAAHPVFASQMKQRLRQGAKLIVVDPRQIGLVKSAHIKAEHHLPLLPGTNVPIINSLAHVIVSEGLVDEEYVRERCDTESFDAWKAMILKPENSPEEVAKVAGVAAEEIRAAARLYGEAGRGAIYYGLGVTEHSQGSTMVMGMANLAMATGNIGFSGCGVNPLRGQNNVQGSCDMGSFPHELPGYRPVGNDEVRGTFEKHWGVEIDNEPGFRIPNMFDEACAGRYKGMYIQGEDVAQSDPDTHHVEAALGNMDCVVVQDLFLNETAKFAHVFLPGTSFLEKDGTFINAERRINRVRPVMPPKQGKDEWLITQELAQALGYPMQYDDAAQIMDEIAELTPTFTNVSFKFLDEVGSVQWPCNEKAPMGTPIMHIDNFVRGKGLFIETDYVPTEERTNRKFPLLLTTGRILSQYNVGAQTRRTENMVWYNADLLEVHPSDAEVRGITEGSLVSLSSRKGDISLVATITDRVQPGVVYTTFHNPETGANVVTTEHSDWATSCPEYKVTAVQIAPATHRSDWQHGFDENAKRQGKILETT
jgi:formate dehydrogenase major subunit